MYDPYQVLTLCLSQQRALNVTQAKFPSRSAQPSLLEDATSLPVGSFDGDVRSGLKD